MSECNFNIGINSACQALPFRNVISIFMNMRSICGTRWNNWPVLGSPIFAAAHVRTWEWGENYFQNGNRECTAKHICLQCPWTVDWCNVIAPVPHQTNFDSSCHGYCVFIVKLKLAIHRWRYVYPGQFAYGLNERISEQVYVMEYIFKGISAGEYIFLKHHWISCTQLCRYTSYNYAMIFDISWLINGYRFMVTIWLVSYLAKRRQANIWQGKYIHFNESVVYNCAAQTDHDVILWFNLNKDVVHRGMHWSMHIA